MFKDAGDSPPWTPIAVDMDGDSPIHSWASAHRGKLGQLTPWKIDEKLNSENMQKRAGFYVYVIFWEQSGQADVENGSMLTTYLFRYTSECTIS